MASLPISSGEMPLMEHLLELRQRLMWSFIALIAGVLVSLFFTTAVLEFLKAPYGRPFTVLGPTGGVSAYFRVALMTGGMIALPMITYQLLLFILPGLTRREKRFVLMSLPGVVLLFASGVLFAWFVLLPPALGFLEGFQPTIFRPEWTADLYLGFVTALLFWIGVAFEMPLICLILSLLGAVNARMLLKNWRIAIIAAAVAAAIITPTVDPVNMALVMGPLLILYLISILLAALGSRRRSIG